MRNMCLRLALRKGGVSERASSALPTLQGVLRPSATTVARATFSRAVIAHELTHPLMERGMALRKELVALFHPGMDGLRAWVGGPAV